LPRPNVVSCLDPYVKIWQMHEDKKIEKKKTAIHQKTLSPVFNETFIFSVPYERIRHTRLVISVMDHDRIGRNDKIGQLVLGTKSGPMEVRHWNEMFAKCRQPVAKWHMLKDFD
jgi:Ca2+-dependent lipid-binding protein